MSSLRSFLSCKTLSVFHRRFNNVQNDINFIDCTYSRNCQFILQKYFQTKTNTTIENSDKNESDQKNISEVDSYRLEGIPLHVDINQNSVGLTKLIQERDKKLNGNNNNNNNKINSNSSKTLDFVKVKLQSIIRMVEEVTNIDEVREAQVKVLEIKNELQAAGDKKRQILNELNQTRNNIQKIHSDMRLTSHGSDNYIQLLNREVEYLKKERQKHREFQVVDDIERNLFSSLTSAINNSYEKEKIHTHSIRTLGYIQTIVASLATLIISIIGYYYHNTKFGLLANKLEESVSNTIKSEIGTLQVRLEVMDQTLKDFQQQHEQQASKKPVQQESWGAYIGRHSSNVFRYFWPKSK